MRRLHLSCVITLVLILGSNSVSVACEPAVPLAFLVGSPTIASFYLLRPFFLIGIAVAIKCFAFALFEKRLHWLQALKYMAIANIVSTFIGIIVTAPFVIPGPIEFILLFWCFGFLVVWWLTILPARRLSQLSPIALFRGVNPNHLCVIATLVLIISIILYVFARFHSFNGGVPYWVFKLCYIYAALIIGIGLTTLWEEAVVAQLGARHLLNEHFYSSAIKANLVTLSGLLLYSAIRILPKRLASPDFLAWLWESMLKSA